MGALVVVLILQGFGLTVTPRVAEVGQEVQVRAVTPGGGPWRGVEVAVLEPGGDQPRPLGEADPGGLLGFTPSRAGTHEFRARVEADGSLLVVPYVVRPPARRWLVGLLCVPAGLVLLVLNLRVGRRRDGGPETAAQDGGPPPPAR